MTFASTVRFLLVQGVLKEMITKKSELNLIIDGLLLLCIAAIVGIGLLIKEEKGTVGNNVIYQVVVQAISWPEAEEMK